MPASKKFLSKKKVSQQTISISPALKDWILRYVNQMQKEFPNDTRYKSVSAFYCNVMEKTLDIFQKGKNLDDFERVMDREVDNLFNENATLYIPFVEHSLTMQSLYNIDSIIEMPFFFTYLKFLTKNLEPYDINKLKILFERLKNRYLKSNILQDINLEITTKTKDRGYNGILTLTSKYPNTELANVKITVALLGFIGIEVIDTHYSKQNKNYFRIKLTTSELFFNRDEERENRIKLAKYNVNSLINLVKVLDNDTPFLWQRMALDKDLIIDFMNEESYDKWINNLREDIKSYAKEGDLPVFLLKFFEHLHWIRIEDEKELKFHIRFPERKYPKKYNQIIEIFSKFGTIRKTDDDFFLIY